MTDGEKIRKIETKLDILYAYCGDSIDDELDYDLYDFIDEIMDMLKSSVEQSENKPLTLDKLRQMDGEPVWIDDWYQDFHGWELSADASDYLDGRNQREYGSAWLAYARKPEGSEKA